jgi:hypothetical protein
MAEKKPVAIGGAALSIGFTLLVNADRLAKFFGIVNIPRDAGETLVAFASVPTPLAWGVFLIGVGCLWYIFAERVVLAWGYLRRQRVEPSHVIAFGLFIAIGGLAWQMLRAAPHPDPRIGELRSKLEMVTKESAEKQTAAALDLSKTKEALEEKNRELEKAKSEAATKAVTVPPASAQPVLNPAIDLVHGPYEREEVRLMILALGEMRDAIEEKIKPTLSELSRIRAGWSKNLTDLPKFRQEIDVAYANWDSSIGGLYKLASEKHVRFRDELVPTIDDPVGASKRLPKSLHQLRQTLTYLIEMQMPAGPAHAHFVERDMGRITDDFMEINLWVQNIIQHVEMKTRRLRNYKT